MLEKFERQRVRESIYKLTREHAPLLEDRYIYFLLSNSPSLLLSYFFYFPFPINEQELRFLAHEFCEYLFQQMEFS